MKKPSDLLDKSYSEIQQTKPKVYPNSLPPFMNAQIKMISHSEDTLDSFPETNLIQKQINKVW